MGEDMGEPKDEAPETETAVETFVASPEARVAPAALCKADHESQAPSKTAQIAKPAPIALDNAAELLEFASDDEDDDEPGIDFGTSLTVVGNKFGNEVTNKLLPTLSPACTIRAGDAQTTVEMFVASPDATTSAVKQPLTPAKLQEFDY